MSDDAPHQPKNHKKNSKIINLDYADKICQNIFALR